MQFTIRQLAEELEFTGCAVQLGFTQPAVVTELPLSIIG